MTCLPCYIILRGLRVFNYAKRRAPSGPLPGASHPAPVQASPATSRARLGALLASPKTSSPLPPSAPSVAQNGASRKRKTCCPAFWRGFASDTEQSRTASCGTVIFAAVFQPSGGPSLPSTERKYSGSSVVRCTLSPVRGWTNFSSLAWRHWPVRPFSVPRP